MTKQAHISPRPERPLVSYGYVTHLMSSHFDFCDKGGRIWGAVLELKGNERISSIPSESIDTLTGGRFVQFVVNTKFSFKVVMQDVHENSELKLQEYFTKVASIVSDQWSCIPYYDSYHANAEFVFYFKNEADALLFKMHS